jgi:diguanylate cyclase (GGDEF)-like protein
MTTATERPRIIIIDDSKLMRVSLKNVLKDEFVIVEAENGEQGWELLLRDATLQVVITDAQMPLLDGYELIARVRASQATHLKEIPIIMITGADDQSARERALQTGATDFVTKPFDKTQLLARVRSHAKLDQTSRKLAETAEALAEQGAVDPLTNLSSRRNFIERGAQDLAAARRRNQDLSFIALHVDGFDAVVARHGKDTGDKVQTWVATKLKDMIRAEDTLARLDDARFAIVATGAGRLEGAVLCERARKAVSAAPFTDGAVTVGVTLSLGLACHSFDKPDNAETFLAMADRRAARAQHEGGNKIIASDAAEKKAAPVVELAPNVDSALQLLASKNLDRLKPHFLTLMRRVLPLFEAAESHLKLGIGDAIATIKTRLEKK